MDVKNRYLIRLLSAFMNAKIGLLCNNGLLLGAHRGPDMGLKVEPRAHVGSGFGPKGWAHCRALKMSNQHPKCGDRQVLPAHPKIDINARTKMGETALAFAARHGYCRLVKHFL